MNYKNTYRILGRDAMICNDTYRTGLNNNDLIIGPSGAGKTRGYVKPNILQCSESLIVADTKGSLLSEVGPALERAATGSFRWISRIWITPAATIPWISSATTGRTASMPPRTS